MSLGNYYHNGAVFSYTEVLCGVSGTNKVLLLFECMQFREAWVINDDGVTYRPELDAVCKWRFKSLNASTELKIP